MRSWAHDDSCYYIWDCIVCSDDKPVEERVGECICQRKIERKKKSRGFFFSPCGFFWAVCFVSSRPDTHIKSVFAFGRIESCTFFCESCLYNQPILEGWILSEDILAAFFFVIICWHIFFIYPVVERGYKYSVCTLIQLT